MRRALAEPSLLAFIPALALGAFWLGGEGALIATALGLPAVFAMSGAFEGAPAADRQPTDPVTGLPLRDGLLEALEVARAAPGLATACIVLELDDLADLRARCGTAAEETALRRIAERLSAALRTGDTVARLTDGRFAVALDAARRLDLEAAIQIAGRLQNAVEEPVGIDGDTLYLTASVGFALSQRLPGADAEALLEAGLAALAEAQAAGPSAIRAHSSETARARIRRADLADAVAAALESGRINAWFQPQISTETGRVTGFEALARWTHPERGPVPPAEFLPALEEAGLLGRLGEIMLRQSLTALAAWDRSGLEVPAVSVNVSAAELRDPRLADRLAWELDRFGVAPERLTLEVLETVIAGAPEDVTARNVNALAAMGCGIDLDDFGTGHASIASLRRFRVNRIKIDRSFVAKCDRDPDQQRLVTAILSMADQLGLGTVAEGVETGGEHALLAQLGCGHVQGFAIAHPMPFEHTSEWIARHAARLDAPPRIGRGAG
ncbi:diguanylate cyclase [Rhodosalinus halophilus]|uniref:Diguanylate cyclase n=1 Tax=Rhodosalinus halophilus TaxID=2259333 RepID=A0A365U6X4_9RHOB|nr:bifunctional diguanylate cyclase/phosphodiesterase [Rhodosalinus halophilus]RBI84357.1 diguanylate cyclase [Rhodosalinus halophilus]